MTAPTFLTVRQVAERHAVSVPTVWRWARERADFPKPQRLGPAATRWRLADLEAWEKRGAAS
ncbi:AlpA family phage regulatory protein [Halomonas sp. RT37]|uniref:AlpA family phage regulatory protein n=1 Tax=Halomonas sp. RT37 TaxID=2950872 RepID=A0AAU7KKF7_9GAMM